MSLRGRRHAVRSWAGVGPACGFVLGALLGGSAMAADVYRCQIQGVTTFVDSPQRCPEGTAQRQGGAAAKAREPSMPDTRRMGGAQDPSSALAAAVAACQALAQNPTGLRACLHTARRAEVRQIATARLALSRRAVNDYFIGASRAGHILATPMRTAPVAWCEQVLGDLMAGRNFEVVDDETLGGPEQVRSGSAGRHAVPVLDADFQTWQLGEERVPSGYVTTRWREKDLVVVRIAAACTEGQDGRAHCVSGRYTSISVYGSSAPEGCDVSAYGRSYWPNWKATQTPIFVRGLPAAQ
jgi:hypothetical protein